MGIQKQVMVLTLKRPQKEVHAVLNKKIPNHISVLPRRKWKDRTMMSHQNELTILTVQNDFPQTGVTFLTDHVESFPTQTDHFEEAIDLETQTGQCLVEVMKGVATTPAKDEMDKIAPQDPSTIILTEEHDHMGNVDLAVRNLDNHTKSANSAHAKMKDQNVMKKRVESTNLQEEGHPFLKIDHQSRHLMEIDHQESHFQRIDPQDLFLKVDLQDPFLKIDLQEDLIQRTGHQGHPFLTDRDHTLMIDLQEDRIQRTDHQDHTLMIVHNVAAMKGAAIQTKATLDLNTQDGFHPEESKKALVIQTEERAHRMATEENLLEAQKN